MLPFILALIASGPASAIPDAPAATPSDTTVEEILVEGRRQGESPYRIPPEPPRRLVLPKAEFGISKQVNAAINLVGGNVGGIPTNRAMISIKIRF